MDTTNEFFLRVRQLNKDIFGNIFKRKRNVLSRIQAIDKALDF